MKRHILITGERGVGKSTLIRRLQQEWGCPVYGFRTVRQAADETGFHPIYIQKAACVQEEYRCEEENRIGSCNGRTHAVNKDVFNTLGAQYIEEAQQGGVIVMDELGFMEAEAEQFKRAVFFALEGDIPVIAAVKARQDIAFLNEVRSHPKADLFTVTPQNREELFQKMRMRIRNEG
ncbi:MAG: hypothetical protein IJB22_02135 [Clostridia bacterium]|nr:hypothetical protein [Clostridia bacterium]